MSAGAADPERVEEEVNTGVEDMPDRLVFQCQIESQREVIESLTTRTRVLEKEKAGLLLVIKELEGESEM